jgi:uncharacterized membrane protein YidH (DUF202 family)
MYLEVCLITIILHKVVGAAFLQSDMATSLLGRFFHSGASSHDNHINFLRGDLNLNVPSNTPTTQLHSPSSQSSSSPSLVRHMVTPRQVASSSAMPIDDVLSDSDPPRSIQPNSNSGGQSGQKLEPSTTSKDIPNSSHDNHSSISHFHPALVLQNRGSVARDHLASERTFLAYVRTSLGLASAGVALIQLFTMADLISKSTGVPLPDVNEKLQRFAAPLGLSAVAMSLVVLFIGELLFIFS